MKVKFLTSIAGANFSHSPAEGVVDIDDKQARAWIKAGLCEKAATSQADVRQEKREKAVKVDKG